MKVRNQYRRSGLLLCLLLGPCSLSNAIYAEVIRVEEGIRVVTESRRERALEDTVSRTEVINREDIRNRGARNLSDILQNQPGIEVLPALRGSQVRIQGLNPDYTLILINGERMTGRVDGGIDLSRIKAEDIERIEIIKGASSALHGSDAMAGVINIITRQPQQGAETEVQTLYGSGREQHFKTGSEVHTSFYTGLNRSWGSTAFTGGWHRGDGYDLVSETDRLALLRGLSYFTDIYNATDLPRTEGTTGPAFQDINIGNRTTLNISESMKWNSSIQYSHLHQELVELAPPRIVYDRTNETHDFSAGMGPEIQLSPDSRLSLSGYYTRYLDHYDYDQRQSDELDRSETTDERLAEGKIQYDGLHFERHYITAGTDIIYEEITTPRIAPPCRRNYPYICPTDLSERFPEKVRDEPADRIRGAFFMQDEWMLSDRFTVVPGFRYDQDSQFGVEKTPKLALRYDAGENWILRASAARGYRAPSFKELYYSFQNPGVGYQVTGNENLQPERSLNYNAGFEYDPNEKVWVSANLFYNSIDNLIDFRLLPENRGGLATFQTVNVRKAETQGIETAFHFSPFPSLNIRPGYSYTETLDRDFGIPLEGRAMHRGTLTLDYTHYRGETAIGFSITGSVFGLAPYWYRKEPIFRPDGSLNQKGIADSILSGRALTLIDKTALPRGDLFDPEYGVEMKNAYTLLNIRAFIEFGSHFEFFIGIDNVLDTYDIEMASGNGDGISLTSLNPQKPRFYYTGLTFRWASAAN